MALGDKQCFRLIRKAALPLVFLLSACSANTENLYSPVGSGSITGLVALGPHNRQQAAVQTGDPAQQSVSTSTQQHAHPSINVVLASLKAELADEREKIAALKDALSGYLQYKDIETLQAALVQQRQQIDTLGADVSRLQAELIAEKKRRLADQIVPEGPFSSDGSGTDQALSYGLHLASYEKREQVRPGWLSLKSSHSEALAGLTPYVIELQLPDLGTYYRLLLGPVANRQAAESKCREMRAADQYCKAAQLTGVKLDQ